MRGFVQKAAVVLAVLLGWTGLSSLALAQPVNAPTREEVLRGSLDRQLRAPDTPLAVDDGIERAPCPLADPHFATLRFTLRDVRFTGLELVGSELVRPAFSNLLGKDLPVAAVCEIRDRAATILRKSGYLAAVQVPEQTIDEGMVRFEAIVARMASVQVRGEAGPSEVALRKYIERLAAQPVFNINDAERYLLLARDIPGLDVRLSLQPAPRDRGAAQGDVIGVFDVVRTPFYADLTVQNLGSREVGRFGGIARLRLNGLTGLGDETVVSFYSTADFKEQQVVQAAHEFRPGGEGLKLGGNFTYAWTKPDVPGSDEFRSRTLVASAYATYPLVRKQARNLAATLGFDLIDQDVDFASLPLTRDRLRVLFARLDFSATDKHSIMGRNGYSLIEPKFAIAGSIELRKGIEGLGASKGCGTLLLRCLTPGVIPPGRIDGDPHAFVVRAQARIDYRPIPELKFSLTPRAQYSPDALFSYEEVSGGNYTIGRGYDPGVIIGDSGYGIQAELAYGSLMPASSTAYALQPYVFVDHMAVHNKNIGGDPQRITSLGGGLRAVLGRRAMLDVTAAVPLDRSPFQARRGDARVLASLTVQLAPWRSGR